MDSGGWIALATVVAGLIAQQWRAERIRKWDVEDRAALAKKVIDEAKVIAAKVNKDAEIAQAHSVKLMEAIDTNTAISTQAFHEANSVNLKIEKLGIAHNQLQKEKNES